jgi:hypothetical protein
LVSLAIIIDSSLFEIMSSLKSQWDSKSERDLRAELRSNLKLNEEIYSSLEHSVSEDSSPKVSSPIFFQSMDENTEIKSKTAPNGSPQTTMDIGDLLKFLALENSKEREQRAIEHAKDRAL